MLVRIIDEAFRRKRELNHEKHERHEPEDIRRGESGNTVRQAPVAVRVSGLSYPIQSNPVLSCSCLSCFSWLKIGSGLPGPSHPAGHIRNRPDYSATISKSAAPGRGPSRRSALPATGAGELARQSRHRYIGATMARGLQSPEELPGNTYGPLSR